MSRIVAALALTALLMESALAGTAKEPIPNWIWLGKAKEDQVVLFRKTIDLGGKFAAAKLYATCDNEMVIYVNGTEVLHSETWETPLVADVSKQLKDGTNVLAVRGKNHGGPAGLLVKLVIETGDKQSQVIVTDGTWRAAEKAPKGWEQPAFDDKTWDAVNVVAKLGDAPWGLVNKTTLANAGQPKDLVPTYLEQLKAIKDFQADLIYSVPQTQGSWVSMTTAPGGKLIVSDQYGKLYRVTPPPIEGKAETKVEPIALDIGEAQGLLWAFDSLYIVCNRHIGKQPSGLYRVKGTAAGKLSDKVELLRELHGGGEHGPHAVLLGPDGKSLYICCGNHTAPTKLDGSLVPKVWGEDSLLTRLWDPNGHAVGIMAPAGCIYKTDPDGKKWDLVCMGFRNQYDAAFNREGELFTYDSDMEWDMNTPWYQPTRVFHCVSGGECGWRGGTGKFPTYYPDTLPPIYEVGPGSPTGMTFGYGTKFPAKYQEALFMCDWSYGKLYALHVTPSGASYKGELEEFVRGTPLPLTDIVVNTDGALYFIVGGRKVKSGMYRVTYTGKESTAPSKGSNEGAEARSLRKKLEAFHGKQDPKAIEVAWPYLGHKDRFLRFAARVAIEHQDVKLWQEKALAETKPQAALTALVALTRNGPKEVQPELLDALGRLDWQKLSHGEKLDLLRAYALAFLRMGAPNQAAAAKIIARLDSVYPSDSIKLNNELCKLLVYLQAPTAAAKSMKLLDQALTQEEQLQYALSLRELKTGWTQKDHEKYFKWFLKAAGYKGGNSFRKFIVRIRDDAVKNLIPAELAQLKPVLDLKPDPGNPVVGPPRPFVKQWTTEDVEKLAAKGLKNRNFDKGRAMFAAANCFACHRFNNEGGSTGPDLTSVAGRFSIHDLVESITEPSKVISDQYVAMIIELESGKVIQGRIINLNVDDLIINTDLYDPNKLVSVNRKQLASIKPSPISMMPTGLLDTLHDDEVLDLLAYLLSGGNREHALFAKKGD